MLKFKLDSEEVKDGYSHFCESLISLMACGAEYRLHSDTLQTSIAVSTSSVPPQGLC